MFEKPREPILEPEPKFSRMDYQFAYDDMSDDEDYQDYIAQTRRGWRGKYEREGIRRAMVQERLEDEYSDWRQRTTKAQQDYELALARWEFTSGFPD
ncbi:hypothetical protein H9P43_006040 [Blastocladiella emersonii ATCC 22665]|nr:hypothetical protein H9P43_006040 [Blastocladiella emersonii ATCC 22665]